jgi:hypothetical protein
MMKMAAAPRSLIRLTAKSEMGACRDVYSAL